MFAILRIGGVSFLFLCAFAAAEEGELTIAARPAAPAFVLKTTFEQRMQGSQCNKPLAADSIIFPQPYALDTLPEPAFVNARTRPLDSFGGYDRTQLIWGCFPQKAIHLDYLARRRELRGEELLVWCEKNNLPECAEFELRMMLSKFKSFQQPGYAPLNQRWRKYADKHQTAFIFPLPLNGEWFVAPDQTGHHKVKAFATYAFDMVQMQNGATFRGNPSKLENYFAWGQPVLAQADGSVTQVRDDKPDLAADQAGGFDDANYVTVNYGGGLLGFYAHLQKGSAKVKVGDTVKPGQVLAAVGNSGASGQPHLHFTLLDHGNFSVKGRYRVEVLKGKSWELRDGEDLTVGTAVRNPDHTFGD